MMLRPGVLSMVAVFLCWVAVSGCGGGDTSNPHNDASDDDVSVNDTVPADHNGLDGRTQDTAGNDTTGVDTVGNDTTIPDSSIPDTTVPDIHLTGDFTVLAWNNLGMHCYNPTFKTLAVLPPYNTIWAQVIRKGPEPEIVTAGITIEYSFPENTYSAAGNPKKSDFWDYAQDLFGVALETDVGLAGKGMTGKMDVQGDHFVAEGIPITEFRDQDATEGGNPLTWNRYPYQLATLVVKETSTGRELTRARVVAPVSSELNCQNCHSDTGSATTKYAITPSGNEDADINILRIHDHLNGTGLEDSKPVLCANCHGSNALGMSGNPDLPNMSKAVHGRHSNIGIQENTAGCYQCHPGPKTKCMRDVMTNDGDVAGCVACHGNLAKVATNPNPWLNEPRCDAAACHGGEVAQDKALYTVSTAHHGIYCAGCHDSPHATAESREPNDGLKFMDLQGNRGPVSRCTVCHSSQPGGSIHEDD